MAAIDYAGIEDQLKTLLEADASLNGTRFYVEEEPQFGLQDAKAVAIFLHSRAPDPEQSLSAGKRTRNIIRLSLWSVFFSIESYRVACTGRDALLGALELVLMKDRTVGGKVASSWLEGGQFQSARDDSNSAFAAAAETILVARASAINT